MTRRVLELNRVWQFESPRALVQWYGYVEIHDNHAIGQWFCVDIESGSVLWDRRVAGANSIRHVGDDLIVASEMRSRGASTAHAGIYVIDRMSGELAWQYRGLGFLGWLRSLLPGERPRGLGTPAALVGSELFTSTGEVVNARTGEHLRSVDLDSIPDLDRDDTDAAHLVYRGQVVPLHGGGSLSVSASWDTFSASRSGDLSWHFQIDGHHVDGNFYSWRFVGDALLIVVADEPVFVSTGEHSVRQNECRYELRVLDLRTGEIAQVVPLTTEPGEPCRIEDVDQSHVLISHGKTLWCYAWRDN